MIGVLLAVLFACLCGCITEENPQIVNIRCIDGKLVGIYSTYDGELKNANLSLTCAGRLKSYNPKESFPLIIECTNGDDSIIITDTKIVLPYTTQGSQKELK